jgi:NAD(P)-dependent dehydrogenase (short-subunit alcohol dehydrogenase family)
VSKNTIVIVGAGPGLGMGIARRFGREGFQVGLICRNETKGERFVQTLTKAGISAAVFAADATDEKSVVRAFEQIRQRLGPVDVLEYSPVNIPQGPDGFADLEVTHMTPARVQSEFAVMALGAVACVNQVLPSMIARKTGTVIITTGISAYSAMPMVGAWGIAGAAARNYALTLNEAMRGSGIFVGTVCIGVRIGEQGDPEGDPDMLAERHFALYRDRGPAEIIIKANARSTP